MSKYITIHIEDFVQIRKADIELAPLTLFVGDNNSGKSYLASLIWGVLNEDFHFTNTDVAIDDTEIQFDELLCWLREFLKSNTQTPSYKKITEDIHRSIVTLINKILDSKKKKIIHNIFGSDIDIGKITFDLPFKEGLSFALKFEDGLMNSLTDIHKRYITYSVAQKEKGASFTFLLTISDNIEKILLLYLCRAYFSVYVYGEISFFPASRTGFLLTYRSLIDESLDWRFNSREKNNRNYHLTSPQVSFLRRIAGLEDRFVRIKKSGIIINSIIDFIENKMIHGKISLSKTPLPDILYCPKNDVNIPMYLSSGVVTEITPMLACLKYNRIGNSCIIEEPEMSLHPELQWRMAQVLIRLAKTLSFVVTSTHSDIIIQHINNMIKLACRSDGKKLADEHGYEETDIIAPDKVRMYQFDVSPNDLSTEITALDFNNNGFIVPTFGKTLRKLRNDVYDFQHEIDDTETKED
ncbi:MAG: ATP-binding protein [Planctomycetaceae bacterium]|jgi:energy-coupling factor transporter ATP-binding protein EcfA2|nr:ATP-binding protein [Planctomycetaceae bacterium]